MHKKYTLCRDEHLLDAEKLRNQNVARSAANEGGRYSDLDRKDGTSSTLKRFFRNIREKDAYSLYRDSLR